MDGRKIIKYRVDNCISQSELAEKLHVSRSTLSRWENNKLDPTEEDMERIRALFGDSYLEDSAEIEEKDTDSVIRETSDRIDSILYQVSKIEANQSSFDDEKIKTIIRHKRLQSSVVIITCLLILALVFFTWLFWMNHGLRGEIKEGPIEMGNPSYFTMEDDSVTVNTVNNNGR